jgi:hypothetical protein
MLCQLCGDDAGDTIELHIIRAHPEFASLLTPEAAERGMDQWADELINGTSDIEPIGFLAR